MKLMNKMARILKNDMVKKASPWGNDLVFEDENTNDGGDGEDAYFVVRSYRQVDILDMYQWGNGSFLSSFFQGNYDYIEDVIAGVEVVIYYDPQQILGVMPKREEEWDERDREYAERILDGDSRIVNKNWLIGNREIDLVVIDIREIGFDLPTAKKVKRYL